MIKVRIVQLGRGVHEHALEPGTTVEHGLVAAEIPLERMEVRVGGRRVEMSDVLQDGDLVTVIPLIRGGQWHPTVDGVRNRAQDLKEGRQ